MERNRRAPVATVSIALTTALGLTAATAGCGKPDDTPRMRVEVVAERPHDTSAFTEGLEFHDGVLYESTGLPGRSFIQTTDAATGAPLTRADLPAPLFGEGITNTGRILWQVTYTEGVAIARDPATLAELRRTSYDGEGWGMCFRDGKVLMSNGSDTLTYRDPETFAPVSTVTLTSHRDAALNELDCAPDGSVYANVFPSDDILRIDPATGTVLAIIDASGLLPSPRPAGADVLNGIAAIPGTDRFLLTGKNWPTSYEVRFVPE